MYDVGTIDAAKAFCAWSTAIGYEAHYIYSVTHSLHLYLAKLRASHTFWRGLFHLLYLFLSSSSSCMNILAHRVDIQLCWHTCCMLLPPDLSSWDGRCESRLELCGLAERELITKGTRDTCYSWLNAAAVLVIIFCPQQKQDGIILAVSPFQRAYLVGLAQLTQPAQLTCKYVEMLIGRFVLLRLLWSGC